MSAENQRDLNPDHSQSRAKTRIEPEAAATPSLVGQTTPLAPDYSIALYPANQAGPATSDQPLPEIPGYETSGEIARGGMGVVYAAHDVVLNRKVAIKTLLPKMLEYLELALQFEREARITARFPHPGIPPVHALGTLLDSRPFLVMKLIEGRTLTAELQARNRVTELPRFLGVFEQICQTVGYAHSQGVLHRDLKPLNVMVGAFGEVQVMDWGTGAGTSNFQGNTSH